MDSITEGVEPPPLDENTANLLKQAGIHLVVAISAVALWAALDSWWLISKLGLAAIMSMIGAIVFGITLSHILHEWGHYIGVRLAGANPPVKSAAAPLFFDFDYKNGTQKQFLWMSFGGAAGNWLLVLVLLISLPFDTIGRVMIWATAAGMTAYVAILEYPVIAAAWRGEEPMAALTKAFSRPGIFKRATLAGLATLAILTLLLT